MTTNYEEYSIIRAKRDLGKVSKGTQGTILIVFNNKVNHYEVEFMDSDGNSIEVLTVSQEDIELVSSSGDKK